MFNIFQSKVFLIKKEKANRILQENSGSGGKISLLTKKSFLRALRRNGTQYYKLLGLSAYDCELLRQKRKAEQNLTDEYPFHATLASSEYILNQEKNMIAMHLIRVVQSRLSSGFCQLYHYPKVLGLG